MRKNLAFVILLSACATSPTLIPLPEGGIVGGDSGIDINGREHPCNLDMRQNDFFNCGVCDRSCEPADADRCERESCRCGPTPSCSAGADCRYGRCVVVDPNGEVCEFDDNCNINSACIEGRCTFIECRPEICDGLDNDCDDIPDSSLGTPLSEWCYSGERISSPVGVHDPCRVGVRICNDGAWSECLGEIPPTEEAGLFACDGLDNNCDLCVDGEMVDGTCYQTEITGFDIIFVIDQSGSMLGYNEAVRLAIQEFSTVFDRPGVRYAIVLIPGVTDMDAELYRDFSNYSVFLGNLTGLMGRTSGSHEASWDSIYEIGTNELRLSFISGHARIIIMFTDEFAQSYRMPRLDETEACAALEHGEAFIVFERGSYFTDFDFCATQTYPLSTSPTSMASLLQASIAHPCMDTKRL